MLNFKYVVSFKKLNAKQLCKDGCVMTRVTRSERARAPAKICLSLPPLFPRKGFSVCDRNKGQSRGKMNNGKSYGHGCVLGSIKNIYTY